MKKLKKEELELMSYNDIAYLLLQDKKNQTTADLFKQICTMLELSNKVYENKIGGFYTALTTDRRFILLDSGKWDLKENHSVKTFSVEEFDDLDDIDSEEMIEEEPIIEDEDSEVIYDENPDDDNNDDDDYKDLVIVDEDELDITE